MHGDEVVVKLRREEGRCGVYNSSILEKGGVHEGLLG